MPAPGANFQRAAQKMPPEILALIAGPPVPFIDTLGFLTRHKPSTPHEAELKGTCLGRCEVTTLPKNHPARLQGWEYRITGQMPMLAFATLMEEIYLKQARTPYREARKNARRRAAILSRVHFALDTPSPRPARLQRYMEQVWVRKWRASTDRQWLENGCTYYDSSAASRRHVAYSDSPSKVTDGPCLHQEVRLTGAATIRRTLPGMKWVDLFEIQDVLWAEWQLFKRVTRDLESLVLDAMPRTVPKPQRAQAVTMFCRDATPTDRDLWLAGGAQWCIDHRRRLRLGKEELAAILEPVDAAPFLPLTVR
ncbi:MAG: hypothetical protein AB7F89_19600 [Pirellulaceae bacterium]